MAKVFISTSSFGCYDSAPLDALKAQGLEVALNPHGRMLKEEESLNLLSDVRYLIAGTESLNRTVLEHAKGLKVISRCGVGMENVDQNAAQERGIKVFNTPDGPTIAVAELTLALILNLLRKVTIVDTNLKSGVWKKQMGNLLFGKKVGIIGFGRIGKKVAELLLAFNAQVAYFDVVSQKCDILCETMSLDEVIRWADIITLHCPKSSDDNAPIIGEEELKKMKKGSWLVNASRGGLVDEKALYSALKEGNLEGAALDVFEEEPYSGPLCDLDNVLLTTHIGSYAREARIKMEMEAVDNLLKCLKENKE